MGFERIWTQLGWAKDPRERGGEVGVFLRFDVKLTYLTGLDFFITEIPDEIFTYSETDPMHFAEARATIYPYLLVNIGSGVSMIKVSGPQQFERIGGSSVCVHIAFPLHTSCC